jgi:Na+-transporting methylmalonyl-CoA/oxaloacetate decarboxylase gamma subunit
MKYVAGAILLVLASMAMGELVNVFRPMPKELPQQSAPPPPQAQAPQVTKVVVVHRVVHEYSPAPSTPPVIQRLNGSTSQAPVYQEKYPGMFVRQQ